MEQARQKALELRDSLILNNQKNGWPNKEWFIEANAFLDYLTNNIADTETPEEEIRDEVFIIIRTVDKDGETAATDLTTCSKAAFVIQLVTDALRSKAAPLTSCSKWNKFAVPYAKYVMTK